MPLPDLLEALERSNAEEIAGLLSAARSEAEAIRAAARAEADQRLGRTLDSERTRLRQASERRRVTARREAAARVLRARAALLDRVFQAARTRAAGARGWPEYLAALEADVRRLRELLGPEPGTLRCATGDAERVHGWAAGSGLSVLASPEVTAGLHCTADGGRLSVDLTLPARLEAERPRLSIGLGPRLEAAT